MTFWRNIASLAFRGVDDASCTECPPGLPGEDPAFSTAVTALGAKLARADGAADPQEFAAFTEVFQPDPGGERNIARLYALGALSPARLEGFGAGARHFDSHEALADALRADLHGGVRILVKGSRGSAMDRVVAALLDGGSKHAA